MKTELLTMLRETNEYVSGQKVCETFGVSRTAVWKAINQLRKNGYDMLIKMYKNSMPPITYLPCLERFVYTPQIYNGKNLKV